MAHPAIDAVGENEIRTQIQLGFGRSGALMEVQMDDTGICMCSVQSCLSTSLLLLSTIPFQKRNVSMRPLFTERGL